ncbi:hypothetical protein MgSA37_04263 [Mucilaginibacter gotjawali]|uniref:ABC-type polysaccharide/polyol phosphate export permease n=2 Tax=Mucilaginibacter gotjawali TaxID=1550579 RepID=A0A839SI00_9SPHI|nr:ABC-type polysaccharide/polyol phosphate export permease [Mucilaginibacter gotjawali]BAU56071.1 hypothetical protein MgSA37_04263 [Mucilaginibacter gotjawali]
MVSTFCFYSKKQSNGTFFTRGALIVAINPDFSIIIFLKLIGGNLSYLPENALIMAPISVFGKTVPANFLLLLMAYRQFNVGVRNE